MTPPHQLDDAMLGTLRLSEDADGWESTVVIGSKVLRFKIGGDFEPSLVLIAHAHEVIQSFTDFERMLAEFLAREACRQLHYADEIRQLVIEEVCLFWPERPDDGMIYFTGPDKLRLWRCDLIGRKPERLGFDS